MVLQGIIREMVNSLTIPDYGLSSDWKDRALRAMDSRNPLPPHAPPDTGGLVRRP